MTIVALICARGGSKGLPGKNLRELGGKPLIAWSIERALEVPRIDRVIVSTDSEEIASTASRFGAEVPFIRPAELARDDSPEWLVWRHTLAYLDEEEAVTPDVLMVVPPTAPLRSRLDLESCLDHYQDNDYQIVITVTDAHRNPYFNMVSIGHDDTAELVIAPDSLVGRRQDAPTVYDMTTVAYVSSPGFVMEHGGIFEGRVGYVHVPVERALDIDNAFDFKIAECIVSNG